MIYAGIGSRETPIEICNKMTAIGRALYKRGFILRSGKAQGADQAFEKYVPKDHKEIFVAKDSEGKEAWFELASRFHPAWDRCNHFAKLLHARNGAILLGEHLDTPVDFVVCWTVGGQLKGGTAQAMRIAIDKNIPIFNLFNDPNGVELKEWLNQKGGLHHA